MDKNLMLDGLFEEVKMDFLNRTSQLNNNEMEYLLGLMRDFVESSLDLVEAANRGDVR